MTQNQYLLNSTSKHPREILTCILNIITLPPQDKKYYILTNGNAQSTSQAKQMKIIISKEITT
jgi:hypothetical protein